MALKDHRPLFRVCYFDIFCSLSYEHMVAIPIVTFCLLNINSAWVIITLLCTATTSSGLMPLCYWHCQLNSMLWKREGGFLQFLVRCVFITVSLIRAIYLSACRWCNSHIWHWACCCQWGAIQQIWWGQWALDSGRVESASRIQIKQLSDQIDECRNHFTQNSANIMHLEKWAFVPCDFVLLFHKNN